MAAKILGALMVLIAGLCVYAGLQPAEYLIERSLMIKASSDTIYPYLANPTLADKWGPWKEVDPDATMNFSGPESGVGAKTSWDSKGRLGTGSATVEAVEINKKVVMKLEYTKPMSMQQDSEYSIDQQPEGSLVTWKVTGKRGYMEKLMGIFMNMDAIVGGMFEKGLANLKALVEKP